MNTGHQSIFLPQLDTRRFSQLPAKYPVSWFFLLWFWSITSFSFSWELVAVREPKSLWSLDLENGLKVDSYFVSRYLVFLIYQPRCVLNRWVTELTSWELLSRPEGQVCESLNQWFSNLSVQQTHQQGLLTRSAGPPPRFLIQQVWGRPEDFHFWLVPG